MLMSAEIYNVPEIRFVGIKRRDSTSDSCGNNQRFVGHGTSGKAIGSQQGRFDEFKVAV
ncbi:hypothetical protein DPMN_180368, partial [Dreissena polymorpha]